MAALVIEACSKKKGKVNRPSGLKVILLECYIKFGPKSLESCCLFQNKRLRHNEQVNRNFGIKSFLSQNWGHAFTPKFSRKNVGT